MNVGVIGLGRMGMPMARQLLRAGFPLTVYNRTASRALLLGDGAAAVVESPAEVADIAAVADDLRRSITNGHRSRSAW